MKPCKPLDRLYLPSKNSQGSFGYVRKNHIHEGVDLYTREGSLVYAMEDSFVVSSGVFTGEAVGSPWWCTTHYLMLEGQSGVINYGEITLEEDFQVGRFIKRTQVIGRVKTVLKKNKGKPMSMLHLELYKHTTKQPIKEWKLQESKPDCLLDPTGLLLKSEECYE